MRPRHEHNAARMGSNACRMRCSKSCAERACRNRDPALLFASACSLLQQRISHDRGRAPAGSRRSVEGVRRPMGLRRSHPDRSARLSGSRPRSRSSAGRPARPRRPPIKFSLDWKFEGPGGAVPGPASTRATSRPKASTSPSTRRRLARADHPRRLRHLRHGLCRHQLADQVPRPNPARADQGRLHGLQQAAVRDRRPQEPRHHRAEGSRGQEARRAAAGRHLRAMADLRQAQRHRRVEGDDRERRHSGARADARRRPDRRHHSASRSRLYIDLKDRGVPVDDIVADADGRLRRSSSTATPSS